MRWILLMLLFAGCAPKLCEESCQGCCDSSGACQAGRSDGECGSNGAACARCSGSTCSPTGACIVVGVGGGSGGGGAAMGGGGGSTASVFVTLRYGWADCCQGTCTCQSCIPHDCVITKQLPATQFSQLRTSDFSSCTTSSTGTDAYNVDCTNNCTRSTPMCGAPPQPDLRMVCTRVSIAAITECTWNP